jgi:copper oxidase (laccase) domain-containing protein
LGGVIESTLELMQQHGARRERIAAAIGPCIHQSSYEVGPEFEAEFRAADPAYARFFVPGQGDRRKFDLPGFCAARLATASVARIETLPLDTYAQTTQLHSHRRSVHEKAGDYGRNCSVIMLG